MPSAREIADKREIRELIENWAIWRDALMWDRFRTVWHDDGEMWATWFQGTADEFIRFSEEGYARGVRIVHFLGGTSIDLAGSRAIAQTKMTISQRASVEDVLCDVLCTGRFYDFLEKRKGRWGFVLRRPIYEKDRIDPVDPTAAPKLDPDLLASFPVGYRHLAYLQTRIGYAVKPDMPGLDGVEVERLYGLGREWLAPKQSRRRAPQPRARRAKARSGKR
ncbi:MAG: nuclear transport factor 2 family protein [Hyphomicrobiales bacterium]|nr:nuclear transport factor 2 family protein [Hyphomicrobiales bacterium]